MSYSHRYLLALVCYNVLCVTGSLKCLLNLFEYKGKHGHNDFFIFNKIFNDLRLLKL